MSEERPAPDELDEETIEFAHRMFDLARAGARELVEYLDAGLPVNLTDPSGSTLLLLAAYHGHEQLVGELVARGADPDRANDRGQTPLAAAAFRGAPAMIATLLDAGADPHAGSPNALETAAFFQRPELTEALAGRDSP